MRVISESRSPGRLKKLMGVQIIGTGSYLPEVVVTNKDLAALGCDLFITGETSHAQYYDALNAGINVIYGGHYTTETVGIQALGQHLQEKFNLTFEFVDLSTGL